MKKILDLLPLKKVIKIIIIKIKVNVVNIMLKNMKILLFIGVSIMKFYYYNILKLVFLFKFKKINLFLNIY